MKSQEIRRAFLNFFVERGHRLVPSSSVVPHDDPTLLFNNAGMNQFKDVFLGKSARDYTRATSSQKCVRVGGKHNDLDNVGHTKRHMTFFEMLGNFSFGDYFKKEAIAFAFEATRDVFGFDMDRVWATVYEEDDEAALLWEEFLPKERIVRMGAKDNFWAMGDTGPCGPCSELHYDRGEAYGPAKSPLEDEEGERYLEFWNLVFMQYNRDSSGKMTPLPKQSVDTGAGLERVAMLKNDVDTVFATDILRKLIAIVEKLSGKEYVPQDGNTAPAFHVIADHVRTLSFAIADGAQPSNLDRGYVLRKLLRRAVRYARGLGLTEPFLAKLVPTLCDEMGEDFRELVEAKERIIEIITLEEEAFIRTLKRGGNLLQEVIEEAKGSKRKEISGEKAFVLKDTYGFPLEEIMLIAKDTGLSVNLEAYGLLEEEAKARSRKAHVTHGQEVSENVFEEFVERHGSSKFVGYDRMESKSSIIGIFIDGKSVEQIESGQTGEIVLKETPFYAEKGGQVGDIGNLRHDKALFEVFDCREPYPGVTVHIGKLEKGTMIVGEPVHAHLDQDRRKQIANHHTATHLLHWALQQVLGPHIRQAGSLVEAERLRFDFNHHKGVSEAELREIERLINDKIRENLSVATCVMSFEEVQKRPDIKQFFGEKYGDEVRLVDIDYSKELCGGTHTDYLGTIGLFKILRESSISAGVRRIEAVVGREAEVAVEQKEDLMRELAQELKCTVHQLQESLHHLIEEKKHLTKEVKELRRQTLGSIAEKALGECETVGGKSFVSATVEGEDGEALNLLGDLLFSKVSSGVVLVSLKGQNQCQLLARVTGDLVKQGIKAGDLIKEIAPVVGGGGGGRPDMARAGGKNPKALSEAIEKARQWLEAKS